MKDYELVIALKSSLSEPDQHKLIAEVKDIITKSGTITDEQALGRKNLSYRIGKETNGMFFVIRFSALAPVPAEIGKKLRIIEDVLRYMVEQRSPVPEAVAPPAGKE